MDSSVKNSKEEERTASRLLRLLRSGVWARLEGYVGRLILFVFISLILLVITALVSLNLLLPGTIFKLHVFLALLVLPFIIGYILSSIEPRKKPYKTSKRIYKVLLLVSAIVILASTGIHVFQIHEENEHLENAHKRFSVNVVGTVTQNRIDSTLIELDSQLSRLNGIYGRAIDEQVIKLVLYENIASVQNSNNVPKWVDAYITYRSGKPEIHLPAEQSSDSSRKSNPMASPRPAHEIAHYILREIVGEGNKGQIPLWFNEGFAQYESLKGFSIIKTIDRAVSRFDLWLLNLSNPKILENGRFVIQSSEYPNEYIDIYYTASMEFVHYIAAYDGAIKNILYDVARGEQFSIAFEKEVGRRYEDVYKEWYSAFFKG